MIVCGRSTTGPCTPCTMFSAYHVVGCKAWLSVDPGPWRSIFYWLPHRMSDTPPSPPPGPSARTDIQLYIQPYIQLCLQLCMQLYIQLFRVTVFLNVGPPPSWQRNAGDGEAAGKTLVACQHRAYNALQNAHQLLTPYTYMYTNT